MFNVNVYVAALYVAKPSAIQNWGKPVNRLPSHSLSTSFVGAMIVGAMIEPARGSRQRRS
jgi:hypothetical protein